MMVSRFEALDEEEARNIFELWRAHSFRRKNPAAATAHIQEPQAMTA